MIARDAQHKVDRDGEQQIVIAAEISTNPADFSNLRPMIDTALVELEQAGVTDKPALAVADAGYWNEPRALTSSCATSCGATCAGCTHRRG